MRVQICSHPGLSHFLLLVPLGWALRSEGHEVIVSVADCAADAARSGLEVVDVAPDFDMNAINERMMAEHPELMAAMATTPMTNAEDWAAGIAAVNRPLVDGNIALADAWRPHLVVYDMASTVGLLVADRVGVPAVQQTLGVFGTGRMHEAIAGYLAVECARYDVGLTEPIVKVESYPPSLLNRPPEGPFMRWVPHTGGAVVRPPAAEPAGGRPSVVVSMGTTEIEAYGLGSLASVVEAAALVDADFVLAAGEADLAPLGALPPNVERVGWTPMSSLLRTCDALIHPGGGSTMLHAVSANVPQLIAHDPANLMHELTCNAVRERGIGLAISSDQLDPTTIKTLLADDGLRRATREVHEENEALPSPAATARSIVDLVG